MRIRILNLLLVVLFISTAVKRPASAAGKVDWTVLVYMVGSDLESNDILEGGENGTRDLLEMQQYVQENTNLLVMTGGAAKWWLRLENETIPSDQCCIWHIAKDKITCIWNGSGSMGSPDMFGTFLDHLPAGQQGHSALIFWDHGYGPLEGFGNDQNSEDQRLTLPEIVSVFEERDVSKEPFSLIGFDACFMSSCETVLSLSPYASYLVASEDIEPPEGWDYSFLETLTESKTAEKAGQEIVERYRENYQNRQEAYGLSLIDLKQAETLKPALNELFAELENRVITGEFSSVSRLRSDTWDYARSTGGTEYDLVDVRELAESSGAGQAVLDSLNRSILCHVSNRERGHGLSVYFPQKASADNRRRWETALEALSPGEDWLSFIFRFEKELSAGKTMIYKNALVTDQAYTFELSDEQLAGFSSARYIVLEETEQNSMRIVYAGNNCTLNRNTIYADYQGTTLWFCSGDQRAPMVSIFNQKDSQNSYYTTAAVVFGDNYSVMAVDLQVIRNSQTGEWEILSAYPVDDNMVTGRKEVSLGDFNSIHLASGLKSPKWDDEGVLLPWQQWDQLNHLFGYECEIQETYTVEEAPLHKVKDKTYWLQLIITDIYNNQYASELMPIQ